MKMKVTITDDFAVLNSNITLEDFEKAIQYDADATTLTVDDGKKVVFKINFCQDRTRSGIGPRGIRYDSIDDCGYMKLVVRRDECMSADKFEEWFVVWIAKHIEKIETIEDNIDRTIREAESAKDRARNFIQRI